MKCLRCGLSHWVFDWTLLCVCVCFTVLRSWQCARYLFSSRSCSDRWRIWMLSVSFIRISAHFGEIAWYIRYTLRDILFQLFSVFRVLFFSVVVVAACLIDSTNFFDCNLKGFQCLFHTPYAHFYRLLVDPNFISLPESLEISFSPSLFFSFSAVFFLVLLAQSIGQEQSFQWFNFKWDLIKFIPIKWNSYYVSTRLRLISTDFTFK